MEPILAAVLAMLFALVTAAFHLPEWMITRRGWGGRRVVRDA